DTEADVREPERELRLRRLRAADELMARPDADHTAPRARAHQRTQLHQLEVVRKDVTVGARVLVGERDDRTDDRFVRIGRRLHPTRERVAGPLARYLLEQELRDVTAAVVAQVDDEPVAIAFGAEVAMKLGEAGRLHVRQMEVA